MKKIIILVFLFLVISVISTQEVLKSSKGNCVFQNASYFIQISLTDNYKTVLSYWDNPVPGFVPGVEPVIKVKKTGNIVPFISYIIQDKTKVKTKLFYHISMMKADGTISVNRADGLKIKTWDVQPQKLYRTEEFYGWQFEASDPSGEYKVLIEIFDNEGFSQKFELAFTLE